LFHDDPVHNDAFLNAVAIQARGHFANTLAAKDGEVIGTRVWGFLFKAICAHTVFSLALAQPPAPTSAPASVDTTARWLRRVSLFHQSRFVSKLKYLCEHLRQHRQMQPTNAGDRVVIRVLVRAKITKRYVVVTGSFDSSRTHHANAVAVQKHPNHHHRVICRFPAPIAQSVMAVDL